MTTLPWIASITHEIGGTKVGVTALVKSGQDPYFVEAKPSMILAARKADILLFNGLDLEIGYLPLIMESAKNPRILPGRPGNFDCSRFIRPLDKRSTVDRSMGDVHPLGNPHYHYSPTAIGAVARGIATALGELDRPNATYYNANLAAFTGRLTKNTNSGRPSRSGAEDL